MKDFPTTGWATVALSEVATVVNGGTPKSKVANYWGGDVQWLTPKDMGQMDGREISETPRTITQAGLKGSSARLVPAGSVILSTRAPIGHLAMNTVPMAFNQGCRGIIPSEKLDPVYLYHFLDMSRDLLNELGSGTTFKELSGTNLKSVEIPLPPLEEQQRIVAVLDEAFEGLAHARAHAEANLQNAWELFDGATAKAFSSDEYLSGEETSLAKIVSFHNGDRGKNYPNKHEYVQSGIPWINTGHIEPDGSLNQSRMNFITEEKFEQLGGGKIQPGDLVFCLRGATIGKTAFVDPFKVGAIASSLMIIRPSRTIDGRFLYYYLTGERGKTEIERFIGGAAQPNLAGGSVGQFKIILPSIEVQEVIASNLNRVRNYCKELSELYSTKLQDIDNLRQSLLQQAFAGELT